MPNWLYNINAAFLKPDQELTLIKDYVIPRLIYATQTPRLTSTSLRSVDRLVQMSTKRKLHLNVQIPDAAIHASVRDGSLGIMEWKSAVPNILLKRLVRIRENDHDPAGQRLTYTDVIDGLMRRLSSMGAAIPPIGETR